MYMRKGPGWLVWGLALLIFALAGCGAFDQGDDGKEQSRVAASGQAEVKRGLISSTDEAFRGYTLFAPQNSTTTYLVDIKGQKVHSWPSKYMPGLSAYLLDDGSILRAAREPGNRNFKGGGIGGRVQRIALDGTVLWNFAYADERHCQHHDIQPLPSGNVLLIAWEKKTRDEAIAAGRDPEQMKAEQLWPDCVIEVQPQGETGGKIIWEWHVWDHLVQEVDESKPNYGVVADHPELVDLNHRWAGPRRDQREMRRLRSLGYVGGAEDEPPADADHDVQQDGPRRPQPPNGRHPGANAEADWCHTNSVDYNERLDQIALSVNNFCEVWIIDHSTSTKEAAGHRGGRCGKGGDLLYRWGNPAVYGAGERDDQLLFAQHDGRWIPEGYPGAGHLMVFNNGRGRPDGQYSSVVEFVPPVESSGKYRLKRGKPYEPAKLYWEYTAENKEQMFSASISGAQRLPNGNTLICVGEEGRVIEVNRTGKTVWEYLNPYIEHDGPRDAFGPPGGPPPDGPAGDGRGWPPPPPGAGAPPPPGAGAPPPPDGATRTPPTPDGERQGGDGGRRMPPMPGGPPGGVFRATRLSPDEPGIKAVLKAN